MNSLRLWTEAANARASAFVREGMALAAVPSQLPQALACFDRALALRLRLPRLPLPLLLYDLAGTWMNRAEALVRLAEPQNRAAIESYSQAIALLQRIPVAVDPRVPLRQAVAYQNRAVARGTRSDEDRQLAMRDLIEAVRLVEHAVPAERPGRDQLLAAAWANFAGLQLQEPTPDAWQRATQTAARALDLLEACEPAVAQAVAERATQVRQVSRERLSFRTDG